MSQSDLQAHYDRLKAEGEVLAGGLLDIPRRIAVLTYMYLDSGRNHAFSQIAAHGALWGLAYFEAGGSLGRLTATRYFYSRKEKAYRLGILREFAEGFRRVNRQVCIDTYANYEFTKQFGENQGAEKIVDGELLDALNRIHHARSNKREMSADEKREIFERSFREEQEVTVAPGVAEAVAGFQCPIMRSLCLHPLVRFSYFPRLRYFFFRDFSSTEERIDKGLRAYDIAVKTGWDRVFDSMEYYGQMPRKFFAGPEQFFQDLKTETIRQAQIAIAMD
jgi:hypothetical protein